MIIYIYTHKIEEAYNAYVILNRTDVHLHV